VESGLFTFLGATTENPSFEVNSALLSRAAVYVLQPLSAKTISEADRAPGRRTIQAVPAIEAEGASTASIGLCRRRCEPPAQHARNAGGRRRRKEKLEATSPTSGC
jgi:hypothetical protein